MWADLELTSDIFAGPMYSVLQNGNHDYVYEDKGNRFPGVTDSASFKQWGMSVADEYKARVQVLEAQNAEEEEDKQVLSNVANAMSEIVELSSEEVVSSHK